MDEEITESEGRGEQDDKSISADLIRGHINTIILRALYDGDKYGYEIIAEIERKSKGQYTLKQPSLYSALKRLEKDGYVSAYWGGSVAGGRRKYFSLTERGREISEQNQSEWEYSRTVIDSLISDKEFDFSNPAPSAVNMRVLRSSTSRVPSREGGEDELDYDAPFDDSLDRARLEQEYSERSTELEQEYTDRSAELEQVYADKTEALEKSYAEKAEELEKNFAERNEELEKELAEKRAELDRESADKLADFERERAEFEERKKNFDEEMSARAEAYRTEQAWRESELSEREKALAEERASLEQLRGERIRLEQAVQEAEEASRAEKQAKLEEKEALLAEKEARLAEEEERLEREKTERMHDFEEELAERRRAFEEETEVRKAALDQEEADRRQALQEEYDRKMQELADEEASRKAALDEEDAARKEAFEEEKARRIELLEEEEETRRAALDDEIASRRAALDDEEDRRRKLLEEQEEARKQTAEADAIRKEEREAFESEKLRMREEQLQKNEAFYLEERARLTALLHEKDAQIEAERKAHAEELSLTEERVRREQEEYFREREQMLIHQNYMDLVKTPPAPPQDRAAFDPYRGSAAPEAESAPAEDYRTVVQSIYSGALPSRESESAESYRAAPLGGMDFSDLDVRARNDGLVVTTVGNTAKQSDKHEEGSGSVFNKGKALFWSALVVFVLCVIEGSVLYGLRSQVALPLFYPYFVWGAGAALLLLTGVAYANRYGARAIRSKNSPAMINATAAYTLSVIVTLIVALAVNIDFNDINLLATYVIVPVVFFFGIVVFGICYYLLSRSDLKNR